MNAGIFIFVMIVFASATNLCAQPPETLKEGANNAGINIGCCYGGGLDDLQPVMQREYTMIVAENNMKFSSTEPTQGNFSFNSSDAMVTWANSNNIKVRGHCLVWHNQASSWFSEGDLTRDEMLAAMKNHITTVVQHFAGSVREWDVVNEAIDDGDGFLRNSFLVQKIGDDFIDSAFVYARQADPTIMLYYNDYGAEGMNGKADKVYQLVSAMVENNIPIDAVGFQCHFSTSYMPSAANIDQNIKRLAALGLKVSFTEIDISAPDNEEATMVQQATQYADLLRVFLANRPVCQNFLTWGVSDKYTWLGSDKYPLPFDSLFEKKPAYDSLLAVLAEVEPVSVKDARTSHAYHVFPDACRSAERFALNGKSVGAAHGKHSATPIVRKNGNRPLIELPEH